MISINYLEINKRTFAAISEDFIAGAISFDNFIIVIDSTLFPYTGKKLRNQVEKVFKLPVKFLFLTHYHGDHLWGISAFKDVNILGSELLIKNAVNERPIQQARFEEWMNKDPEKAKFINEIDTAFFPTITFMNKVKIFDGDLSVELNQCGGHTSCSSYAYFPEEKVLFSGDIIFAQTWPWAGDPTCNPDSWIKTLEEIIKLDIDTVIPGHGPIVMKDEVEIQFNFLKDLRKEVIYTIENDEEIKKINIPPFYKDNTPGEWVKNETIKSFYNFYRNKFN
ncbi:MAG: MBL fold metallo-hydrolase [Promethearchaeota archaeon]